MNVRILSTLLALVLSVTLVAAVPVSVGTLDDCRAAIKAGQLTGTINDGVAEATNTAGQSFYISLASYNKYDENISNQIIFDSAGPVLAAPGLTQVSVEVPTCAYQIDFVCGDPLQSLYGYPAVQYGDRKIAWKHIGGANYCTPEQVPEFSAVVAAVTAIGALAGLVAFRKRN